MRVLLDENVDRRRKKSFDDDFEYVTVTERGWSGKKKEAYNTGKTTREVAHEKTYLSEEELDWLLDACKMTEV